MNEGTRKGANALVAVVDFMASALAGEAQAVEEKQRQLDQLAGQLKAFATQLQEHVNFLKEADAELEAERAEVARLRALVDQACGHIPNLDIANGLRSRAIPLNLP